MTVITCTVDKDKLRFFNGIICQLKSIYFSRQKILDIFKTQISHSGGDLSCGWGGGGGENPSP